MAALMVVLMVPVCVRVLVGMRPRFVAMLVPIMRVGAGPVAVFMLMLIFVVAAHASSPPFP